MKKNIFLILASVAAIVSCTKSEPNKNNPDGSAPAIFAYDASAQKTTLGSDWTVSWEEGDNLTVFNVASGDDEFSDNCRFTLTGTPSNGKFTKDPNQGKALITGASAYDWYVCSPWQEFGALPGGTKGYVINRTPQQLGYNSSDHISAHDIMAGKAYGVADGVSPSVALHHVGTLMKFTVTNASGQAAVITGLTMDATAGGSWITGSFTMNWGASNATPALDPTQMGSAKAYTCALTVVKNTGTEEEPSYEPIDTAIPNGSSVDLYMVVAPFSIPAGGKVKLTISGSLGNTELEKKFDSAITFAPGTYNTAAVNYTKPDYVVFTDTFGSNSVAIASYTKTGLTTAVASHKDDYTYTASGNASIQASTAETNIASNYGDCGLAPAYVRFPATTNDGFIVISNITVDENSDYVFTYNKVKGGGNAPTTVFGWRVHGTTTWTYLNQTNDEGLISQSFTTGEGVTKIDIMVKGIAESGHAKPYTTVDNFSLILK